MMLQQAMPSTLSVALVEVPVAQRGPILRRYVEVPRGRPHIPVATNAPIENVQDVAADFPMFGLISGTSH